MKKLFVAVLAIAALAACNKDNEFVPEISLDSKSVTVCIENSAATRAGEAGVTVPGVHDEACAEAKDMNILFADASGKILKVLPLVAPEAEGDHTPEYAVGEPATADGKTTYIWHNVPASITQIAVVRDLDNDAPVTPGTTTLENVRAKASIEANNLADELNHIFLYAESTLSDKGACAIVNGVEYKVWEGSVRVAPLFARLEITSIQCTDLGATNIDADINTFGYDELVLNSLTWTGSVGSYNIALAEGATSLTTLYSQNNKDVNNNTQKVEANRVNYWTADGQAPVTAGVQSKVWSWNVTPQTFTQMDLAFTADAYDYQLTDRSVALKVIDLSLTDGATEDNNFAFAAENIYRVNLDFTEADLTGKEGRCVRVIVEIAPWSVKTVYPVYGK